MKGYKAFKKSMICRGKQYAENTIFEEEKAEICKSGMHFCKHPLDVLRYYSLIDCDGNITEFAEVEALDSCITDDYKKYCTKKLKIGNKIDFSELIRASINFESEEVPNAKINSSDEYIKIISSDNSAKIETSGDYAKICSNGDYVQISSRGDYAKIDSNGYAAQIGSNGNGAYISSCGNYTQIGSTGLSAQIGICGDNAQIVSSGECVKIDSSGHSTDIGSSGNNAQISSSGNHTLIGSSGNSTRIMSSGNDAKINSTGKYAVICCTGNNSIAKAKKGSWITLSEWTFDENKDAHIPVCVKTEFVDGEKIKADTFYRLENGEFVEYKNSYKEF